MQPPKKFYYFVFAFFILNIIQSIYTELIYDEAYYWYFSQEMAWGYFDHPPMVALLVKLSRVFSDGELGVRLMSCILGAANLIVLWDCIENPNKNRYIPEFFVLVFSMTLMNAYGFLTLPDTPLLFFTTCFLWTYQRFLKFPNSKWALLLGLCMAALMYSKYHAVLVIFFVLLSNPGLLKNKYAWLSVAVAIFLYLPHLNWLYEHDFVSIKYHLYERPKGPYEFDKNTLGYFVNLMAIFGLTFPLMYWALYRTKPHTLFKKALVYLTYGVLIFFFISSFNRRIQTQWIIVICIPMVLIVFDYIIHHKTLLRWIYRLGIANLLIILYLRVGLVYQPLLHNFHYESHGNKAWVNNLHDYAGSTPIVFENSYRRAPMYSFYTNGLPTFSLNNVVYRKNQYSIDDSEEKMRHKKILYVSKYIGDGTWDYTDGKGELFHTKYIPDFKSYRKLLCIVDEIPVDPLHEGELHFKVYNPYSFDVPLSELEFGITYMDGYKIPQDILKAPSAAPIGEVQFLPSQDTVGFKLTFPKTKKENIAFFRVAISENDLYFGLNGKPIPIN